MSDDARLWAAAVAVAVLAAAAGGVDGVLLAAASFLVWRGVLQLAAQRDHRATILLALALAAAPLISAAVLFFYPLLLLLAPLLSPWGSAPRRIAGFMTALAAPLALVFAAGLFLTWLFAMPGLSPPDLSPSLQADRFAPLLAAPGALAALAGAGARGWRAGMVFVAGTGGALALGTGLAAVAGAHLAWAATSRRPLLLAASGIAAACMLLAAEHAPDETAALAGGLLRIARSAASP